MTRTPAPARTDAAYAVTGPTSGIGLATALALAAHGTVILIGRDPEKLDRTRRRIERRGGHAVAVLCDLSDLQSVRRAATAVMALGLPIAGLVNNAGMRQARPTRTAQGWDATFATNHLGPFALTEALTPHLADGAGIVFVVSAVEDPERGPAKAAGFRGGRYVSAEAGARGEWLAGGSDIPGADAYATSKQANLAAAMALAREAPRLRINAVEPGVNLSTALSRDDARRLPAAGLIAALTPVLMPFIPVLSTPRRAARVIVRTLLDQTAGTGVYYGERGQRMQASDQARDSGFQDRVLAETRALLAALPR